MLIFKKFSKNKISKYHSFMNCFSKNFTIKNSINFNKFLYKNNLKSKYIVCYLGSIGSNHYLEEIIDSFKLLNDNFVLVVAGSSISGFADRLKNKVINENLQKKVFIFKDVSNKYWFEILKRSQLGLCFYKQNFTSHKFMAGTSQKFNNYVFSNTPMIVNNNNDFLSFKKKFDIFDVVNPNDPKKIASKINFLLTNKARYYKIKKNLKISFLQDLNFEKQYEKSYKTFL
jgi:glycosyltransferase involved in cell wall biosynthesis